ncbi:MAG: NUDIX hydrolase [Eggerthellaceae bacterium]|nr:NUDIX hydrolase [Eggerthellaceae bacterium]
MDEKRAESASKDAVQTPEDEMSEESFLKAYKKKEYPKPSLTADIAVFHRVETGLAVLMVRRGKHPFKGCWALPGGFVGPSEDVVDAARRELEEETGVSGISVELFGIYGTPGRDPRGWTVSGGFCALIEASQDAKAGDDAADAQWCPICEKTSEMPANESAVGASSDNIIEIEVSCGEGDVLMVRFELIAQSFGAPRAHVLTSEGFAFDHAQLLADAYLKVCSR